MARVALISLYDRLAIGLGCLSSYLEAKGHEPHVIHFKRYEVVKRNRLEGFQKEKHHVMVLNSGNEVIMSYAAPPTERESDLLKSVLERIRPDVIGVSFRTVAKEAVFGMSKLLRGQRHTPVIFGGIAPTIEPDDCISFADAICLGEGEGPLVDFADAVDTGSEPSGIRNLWVRHGREIQRNPVRPLIEDLDSLPFPDYRANRSFLIHGDHLREGVSIKDFNGIYEIMTARGCPYACTFCCNSQLRTIYRKEKYLRRRSVSNVIQELVEAKTQMPFRYVNFQDDVFTFNKEWLRAFSKAYKKHVAVPFWCYHHPNYSDRETLEILKESGVHSVTMGIQSGSEDTLRDVFNRFTKREKVLASARMLEDLKIAYNIDIITNNPLEREPDCGKTLDLLLEMPKPVHFNGGLSHLMAYPGTKIGEMIKQQSGQAPLDDQVFCFYNLLYLLCQTRLPRGWIRGFQKNGFARRHPEFLKLFLLLPWLRIDVRLTLKNRMPSGVLDFLRTLRRRLR